MSLITFSVNEAVTSSKMNQLAAQLIGTTTSGARPGSPVQGQTIYQTDNPAGTPAGLYTYDATNRSGWFASGVPSSTPTAVNSGIPGGMYQNGAVSVTVTGCYIDVGCRREVWLTMSATNIGLAGNNIYIQGVASINARHAVNDCIGFGQFYHAGTAYICTVHVAGTVASSPSVYLKNDASGGNFLGALPSFAVAAGDTFTGYLAYTM